MKIQKLAALLLTIPLSFGASQAALADEDDCDLEATACETYLEMLCHTIASATFWKKGEIDYENGEQDRLIHKVHAASGKFAIGKAGGSYDKLLNIGSKVTDLQSASKIKIDALDAVAILDDLDDAKDCVNPEP
jgi:hypothetical protein